jgi:hypothetical protein
MDSSVNSSYSSATKSSKTQKKRCPVRHILLSAIAIGIIGFAALQGSSPASSLPDVNVSPSDAQSGLASDFVGDTTCGQCHQDRYNGYLSTAHHRTSQLPGINSIAGDFAPGKNAMTTVNPQLSFEMQAHDGRFYQRAILKRHGHATSRTEQIDIVIGSATKGQTYLYWKEDRLYELPVSYWTALKTWVNSPGYIDGTAYFERPVTPRCLECHATYFQSLTSSPADNQYNRKNFVVGISCERCHGPGLFHVRSHLANSRNGGSRDSMPPIGLTRDRKIDICAQCHGGVGQSLAPAFSFRPGEDLSQYIALHIPDPLQKVDVHGNQVILLERSRCFQSSPGMSCSTCHDVHSAERPAASYSTECLHCHEEKQCGMFAKVGPGIATDCIDCHMPVQDSKLLVLDTDDTRLNAKVRNHWIRVYANPPRSQSMQLR